MGVDQVGNRWRARVWVNGKWSHIGTFKTKEEAQLVYAEALAVKRPKYKSDPVVRFWSKVDKSGDECWIWKGGRCKDGYGRLQLNDGGRQAHVRAHRFAFFIEHGKWPEQLVLHLCDNPICVRPSHLQDGSQSENMIQCSIRGRSKAHVLNPEKVREIRRRVSGGESAASVARSIGINRRTVYGVIRGRTWRHIK